MKDFYGREIQVGDKCILLLYDELEQVTILDVDDYQGGRAEVCTNRGTKFIINSPNRIVDITAISKEMCEQQFFNSVKTLDVKPNDVVIASLIPNQLNMAECQRVFEQLKKLFPNNKVGLMIGLDVSAKNGSEFKYE